MMTENISNKPDTETPFSDLVEALNKKFYEEFGGGDYAYVFTEALAIAKEIAQGARGGVLSSGYIDEKIRHIQQSIGSQFIDRDTGKLNQWEASI